MEIFSELILPQILSYLLGLAVNERSNAIADTRQQEALARLQQQQYFRYARNAIRSLDDEVSAACASLARSHHTVGVKPAEQQMCRLLTDESFQRDVSEWLKAGGMPEGQAVIARLRERMAAALRAGGASDSQIEFLQHSYFEQVEKAIFDIPVLAHWRHQLGLDYLRQRMDELKQLAQEAAGKFAPELQADALEAYCKSALARWDIVDLNNLPVQEMELATQTLLLRQLYMPLRLTVEGGAQGRGEVGDEVDLASDASLAQLEETREQRRALAAGRQASPANQANQANQAAEPSIGELLAQQRRLVVLGDPGAGKTTMLRWMATVYLLRRAKLNEEAPIPDAATLPPSALIPVLIRCRDLGEADLCHCFSDFLHQHLSKSELLPNDVKVIESVILDQIAKGQVLLLIDGLDEITAPKVRVQFCQELERTAARYPDAHIVVTSRVVGYRDMPYRMGRSFTHGLIAELNRADKDSFAQRWIRVTDQKLAPAEQQKRITELIDALHSSDRIERLTGNPMMLTTLALVKRKIGKLPTRRHKLYKEAVGVLLDWNRQQYEVIEEEEALPQLAYLAFDMCKRGVQRLGGDEVLDLLEQMRHEYPNKRAVRRHSAEEFLARLEARSSLLIKSGGDWQSNLSAEKAVWEFRHLTFQEYLAARALLDKCYAGRDKNKTLAEQVAPLAGGMETSDSELGRAELQVREAWREALRLLIADCNGDEVDAVLLAILTVAEGEQATARPRAVLAALCLADEPEVSNEIADKVLQGFAEQVGERDGRGPVKTTVDAAAMLVANSIWQIPLQVRLTQQFLHRADDTFLYCGGLEAMLEVSRWAASGLDDAACFRQLALRLRSSEGQEACAAALVVMQAAFAKRAHLDTDVIEALFEVLQQGERASVAASWALLWLNAGAIEDSGQWPIVWTPNEGQCSALLQCLEKCRPEDGRTKLHLIHLIGKIANEASFAALALHLRDEKLREAVLASFQHLRDPRAIPYLLALNEQGDNFVVRELLCQLGEADTKMQMRQLLQDEDAAQRQRAMLALASLCSDDERKILSRNIYGIAPWLDCAELINAKRVAKCAKNLNKSEAEIRSMYEKLAVDFPLQLGWQNN